MAKWGKLSEVKTILCVLHFPGITAPTTAGSPMVLQQGLKITEELVQRVEVVYVLGLFLLGKHRKKVSNSHRLLDMLITAKYVIASEVRNIML